MKKINGTITLVGREDLFADAWEKPVWEIEHCDLKNPNIFKDAEVLIVHKDGEHKLLKCRHSIGNYIGRSEPPMKKIKRVIDTPKDKTSYRRVLNEYFAELLRINHKVHPGGPAHRSTERCIKSLRLRMNQELDNSDRLPPS